ncbi:MAG: hypothetical protein IPN51_13560 [Chloracidobacterium sp.]|nr:hypothetical protein [Chloracidobacterium sp.]
MTPRNQVQRLFSHLRFGKKPIKACIWISSADFIACHQFNFVEKEEMLSLARDGATFSLANSTLRTG